ncbi:MAG: type II secretion system F family protein, partial [Elusimicrobia bacterium]|nr:type II secretion system F family protein [Elusimicrobiota bacterium]
MQFAYKAKDSKGKLLEGMVEADNQRAAIGKIKSQRRSVIEINEAKKKSGFKFIKPKVNTKDIVIFSRQLSTLVSAGVPIVQGLNILETQAENPAFKTILTVLKTDIESGLSIADAMGKHPTAFTELYVAMIKAGEVGGILDIILERLSGFLESAEALKEKVKAALMYPAIVSLAAGGITIFLIAFVIPIFKDIFGSFGQELPLPTRVIITLSDFLRNNAIVLILGSGGAVYGFKKFLKTEAGIEKFDDISLKVPVFGILLKKVAIAKFSRTLGTLIKSGVPILQGLETVAKTAGNRVIEHAINSSRDS